jgi:hypothetical protein
MTIRQLNGSIALFDAEREPFQDSNKGYIYLAGATVEKLNKHLRLFPP